ncbi:thiol-disulfide isomerase/thioredoxin [Roseimicrobium gellanilyticum]|uniref:Thiol-disulfide isomerase/thioredoxin n=1 Tax=Roseimicrobium gellanilyticum TaxID=748857 RepID=A0A366HQB5_9BACT|nr:carboxypeptidase regulatory-like domain-containing protein [Roseimicrobium gellanilyticum]RBP45123.1 thiol-disulfide isomerase/thioredoxin [Roseimicrobium gellanilyticum]
MRIHRVIFTACGLVMASLPAQEAGDTKAAPVPIVCEVLSVEGKPVPGAKVYVDCFPMRDRLLDAPIIAQGTTDPQGSFRTSYTPPGHWKYFYAALVVDAGEQGCGFGMVTHNPPLPSPEKHSISIVPASELQATVLTPDGKPAADLECWVRTVMIPRKTGNLPIPDLYVETSQLPDHFWRARTDAQGRLRISRLPQGASVHLKHGDSRWAQFPGRYEIASQIKMDGSQPTLRLTEPGSIRGRILLPDGTPASGSMVSIIEGVSQGRYVTAHGDEVKANDQGEFTISSIPPSTYTLHYDTEPPYFRRWIGAEKEGVTVSAGKVTDLGDLVATEAAYVTGEVLDAETGKVIEEPLKFRLAAGKHDLYYRSMRYPGKGYHPPGGGDILSVELKGGERKTVAFKLQPVKPEDHIMGVVVNEEGKPVEHAQVFMLGHGGRHFPATVMTDKSGEFSFTREKGATQEAVLAYDARTMSDIMLVVPGQTLTLQLRENWGKVVGTVVDEDGKPVAGAEVSWYLPEPVSYSGPVVRNVKSDAAGRFEFPRFWAREKSATFFCKAEGLGNGALRSQTVKKTGTTELKFALKKANTFVAGVLMDSAGKPVEGIQVYATGEGQRSTQARTDERGQFRIEGLAKGYVHLRATLEKEESTSEVGEWVKGGDAEVKLTFPAADGEVSGMVVDAAGNPVPAAKVESFERGRKTATDKEGRFKLSGIVNGWFTLKAETLNGSGQKVEREVRIKTGMKDVKIALPGKMEETPAYPLDPVDLIGKAAPQVEFTTWVNCEPLAAHGRGKVRILDFWGIQCAPCIAAFPKVQKFWETHRDKGIEIVATTSFYPEQEVKEFLAKHPTYNFPVALRGENSTAGRDYDVRGIPTYIVIDAFGKIVSKGHDFEAAGKVALGLVGK